MSQCLSGNLPFDRLKSHTFRSTDFSNSSSFILFSSSVSSSFRCFSESGKTWQRNSDGENISPIMHCRAFTLFCTVIVVLPSLSLFTKTFTCTSPQDNPKTQINVHVSTKISRILWREYPSTSIIYYGSTCILFLFNIVHNCFHLFKTVCSLVNNGGLARHLFNSKTAFKINALYLPHGVKAKV